MTIFAPTEAAFSPAEVKNYQAMSTGDQAAVLKYHVLSSQALQRSDFKQNAVLSTMGSASTFSLLNVGGPDDWDILTESQKVVEVVQNPKAIQCSNGVIHFVRKVLLPNSVLGTSDGNNGGGEQDTTTTTTTASAAAATDTVPSVTKTPAASAGKASGKSKTIIYATAGGGGLVLLIVIVVFFKVCKNSGGGGSSGTIAGAQSFDNPMYDMNDPYSGKEGGKQGYVPPQYASAGDVNTAGSFNDPAYMDINGGGDGAGYMEVSPQGHDASEA